MFYIRLGRRTVDSKIDENRCKQKHELIQVMGILYRYTLTASNCSITLTFIYPFRWKKIQCGKVLLFCIFETSVLSICGVNGGFLYFVTPVLMCFQSLSDPRFSFFKQLKTEPRRTALSM